jgi:UDP-N-acetylmuramate: L-alanyl-gamma-D-glutamyl-meso-diaminopimelate ligase
MHVHVIGLCGVGMSAVAMLLRDAGHTISGSDEGFYAPVSDYLIEHNFDFKQGYKASNIPSHTDAFMIGKNAKLTADQNEEVKAAVESGKPIYSYPQFLSQVSEDKERVCVVGSYGKSTWTALLSFILEHAGLEPSYFMGAIASGMPRTSKKASGELFVMEGDEYPSANDDDRSKFMHYTPSHVLMTAATHDHVNVFPTPEDYKAPFIDLLNGMPELGTLVVCADNEEALEVVQRSGKKAVTYGFAKGADYHVQSVDYGTESFVHILTPEGDTFTFKTALLGAHNMQNICGVVALILENEWLDYASIAAGLKAFQGVRRRLDRLTPEGVIPVHEGFGSSYEKARAAIEAMKLHYADKKLIIVFEPHTFSWRNRDALHWYDDVFEGAENVLVYEPATQGSGSHKQLSQNEIVARVKDAGYAVEAIHNAQDGLKALAPLVTDETAILLLTSGELGGLIQDIPRWVLNNQNAA